MAMSRYYGITKERETSQCSSQPTSMCMYNGTNKQTATSGMLRQGLFLAQ